MPLALYSERIHTSGSPLVALQSSLFSRTKQTLVLRPTGGGKSLVRDVCSFICDGVSLTIMPLLSLGTDQTEKISSRANCAMQPVLAFHLDEMDKEEMQRLHAVQCSFRRRISLLLSSSLLFEIL